MGFLCCLIPALMAIGVGHQEVSTQRGLDCSQTDDVRVATRQVWEMPVSSDG